MELRTSLMNLSRLSPKVQAGVESLQQQFGQEPLPLTLLAGQIGSELALLWGTAAENNAVELLRRTEELLSVASTEDADVICTGLLEALWNKVSLDPILRIRVHKAMGTHCQAYCRAWDEFNGIKHPDLQD